ncbi:class II glutamine amidotransferase [Aquirhabdus sp.]|uniref:class II glutamine amidotransferase n=1 Tax=Aquirhabdus sp. TaxID=2824160 RepID=UPI00396C61F1
MCQLLGMNCATPTDITFSFKGFSQRAGVTSDHADGWGIAFFENKACRLFIDNQSAVNSPIADCLRRNPIKSKNVIAHIRKATQGNIEVENSHPFMRELWGRHWIFAHNGDLKNYAPALNGTYLPVGTTDSELAYCALLQGLRDRFGNTEPDLAEIFSVLAELAPTIAAHGTFNFMLSNGQALFAYATTNLHWLIRSWPFSQAHLVDMDLDIDFSHYAKPDDRVAVIATEPLTDNEQWTAFTSGELLGFENGHLRYQAQTHVQLIEPPAQPVQEQAFANAV